jgi:chaperone BCS1
MLFWLGVCGSLIAVMAAVVAAGTLLPASALFDGVYFLGTMLRQLAVSNQFFQMGLLTAVGYSVTIFTNCAYMYVVRPLMGSMKSSITIENKDKNFNAVVDYISDKLLVSARGGTNSLQAVTQEKKKLRRDWVKEWLGNGSKEVDSFDFRPDSNTAAYNVSYKGRTLMLERSKDKPLMGGYSETPFTPESLTISVWGRENGILKELLTDSLKAQNNKDTANTLNIFVQSSGWWDGWELALSKKARDKSSVILDMDLLDVLLSDAQKFLSSGKWYTDLGIPYRRGYLLYGPPGCGKTSFAQVLAGELKLDLCILNLTADDLNDNKLASLFRDAPDRSIICLEDVDSVFVERNASSDSSGSGKNKGAKVSFSGLLNAIDGVASQEGRIFFMTTNHIEKLDPALVRPGRCDVKLELKRASKLQMERMFLRFFPDEEKLALEFSSKLPADELSMAALQGHFLKSHRSAQDCIDDTALLLQQSKPVIVPKKTLFEHFRRVGLTKYAPILEFHGFMTAADLANGFTCEKMEKLSIDFKFDSTAKEVLRKLLADDEDFMRSAYAFAEVSTIRESFLAAYPTAHETLHGEVAPYFRRQQSLKCSNALSLSLMSPNCVDDDDVIMPSRAMKVIRSLSSENRKTHNAVDSDDESIIATDELTHEELDLLSMKFCEILTKNGRGIISHYNLHQLLGAFPRRPVKCAEAAEAFIRARQPNELIATHMNYYGFLKRAGCASYLHSLRGVCTIDSLFAKGKDGLKDMVQYLSDSGYDDADAQTLAEIVTFHESVAGSLMRFELHSRARIFREFTLFFTVGKGSPDTAVGEGCISNEECARETTMIAESVAVPKPYSAKDIERLAFSYGMACTDSYARAVVSLIEIEKHLQAHARDPFGALATVKAELLHPPMPSVPSPPPPPAEPTEWIFGWLKAEDPELGQYANSFIDEGMGTRESLLVGSIFTDEELKNTFSVRKAGHRRLIANMHQKLIQSV